ncbi:MAG: ABC transporter permease [Chloroflexi bacterium]|nr:ABC transporter permease [Chloroflexota bacterium]
MLFRILRETFLRRKRRVALAIMAIFIGSALATALLSVSSDIMEKMSRELRSYGANILVVPQSDELRLQVGGVNLQPVGSQRYIDEHDLVKLKTIFWRNNILGFVPYLSVVVTDANGVPVALTGTWFDQELKIPAGTAVTSGLAEQTALGEATLVRTGVRTMSPWWKVQGRWASDQTSQEAMVGAAVARRLNLSPGDSLTAAYRDKSISLDVVGIVSTGSFEDNQIFTPLPTAQRLLGLSHGTSEVLVSALTLPKEKLAPDIRNKRLEDMTPEEYEKWYCSPIIEAVVTQIKEVIPGVEAKPIRQISEAEGSFAVKTQILIYLVTGVALLASGLGVLTTMTTTVLERRGEIGIMKAIGAENGQVAIIFLSEAALIGLVGGALGYVGGMGLAAYVGATVFNASVTVNPLVLPVAIMLAMGVALLGSALPVRTAMKIEPVSLMRGV